MLRKRMGPCLLTSFVQHLGGPAPVKSRSRLSLARRSDYLFRLGSSSGLT